MVRSVVASTNIRSIGFSCNTLEVEFLNGSVYQYYDVPEEHYRNMINYPHPGTYLARHVKGTYLYKRIA